MSYANLLFREAWELDVMVGKGRVVTHFIQTLSLSLAGCQSCVVRVMRQGPAVAILFCPCSVQPCPELCFAHPFP